MFSFFLLGFGIFIVLMGLLMILYPTGLERLSVYMNKKLFDDNTVLAHRIFFAIICIAIGGIFILMYFKVI